jgi:chaperone LolA
MGWLRLGLVVLGSVLLAAAPPGARAAGEDGADSSRSEPREEPPKRGSLDCGPSTARKVQSHYDGVRDLTARFVQTTQVVSLGTASASNATTSSGEVSFAKPGRMRWSYESPEPSLVVTDGNDLWIYDPASGEAQLFRAAEGFLSGAALQFLLGQGEMTRDFRVRALACEADHALLDLRPRRPAAYEHLEIRVDPATGEVKETAVFDLVGNVTRVAFEQVKTNTGLAQEQFRFDPPPGVEVVEVPEAKQ